MEIIQEPEQEYGHRRLRSNQGNPSMAEEVRELRKELKLLQRGKESGEKTQQFKFPFKWRMKFSQTKRKSKKDMMLIIFLNKKNEIEPPKFMPIFDGNMVVWKNKPYEFDPRAVWTIRGVRGNPRVYLIKEIDRRPVRNKKGQIVYRDAAVSNMDLDAVRARGDSTESDEFLIKAALKAQTANVNKAVNVGAIVIAIIVGVGFLLWFMFGGSP